MEMDSIPTLLGLDIEAKAKELLLKKSPVTSRRLFA